MRAVGAASVSSRPAPCECAHARCPEYAAACELLSLKWGFRNNICCGLRPPSVLLCCVDDVDITRELRVWPGAGGLELFRLQLGALLGTSVDPESVTFLIESKGSQAAGTPYPLSLPLAVSLPGLDSYGVASYCAAIGEALAAEATTPQPQLQQQLNPMSPETSTLHVWPDAGVTAATAPNASAGGGGDDDWIELLCSVADLLEGQGQGLEQGLEEQGWDCTRSPSQATATAPPPSAVTMRVCICTTAAAASSSSSPSSAVTVMSASSSPHDLQLPLDAASPSALPPPLPSSSRWLAEGAKATAGRKGAAACQEPLKEQLQQQQQWPPSLQQQRTGTAEARFFRTSRSCSSDLHNVNRRHRV